MWLPPDQSLSQWAVLACGKSLESDTGGCKYGVNIMGTWKVKVPGLALLAYTFRAPHLLQYMPRSGASTCLWNHVILRFPVETWASRSPCPQRVLVNVNRGITDDLPG